MLVICSCLRPPPPFKLKTIGRPARMNLYKLSLEKINIEHHYNIISESKVPLYRLHAIIADIVFTHFSSQFVLTKYWLTNGHIFLTQLLLYLYGTVLATTWLKLSTNDSSHHFPVNSKNILFLWLLIQHYSFGFIEHLPITEWLTGNIQRYSCDYPLMLKWQLDNKNNKFHFTL